MLKGIDVKVEPFQFYYKPSFQSMSDNMLNISSFYLYFTKLGQGPKNSSRRSKTGIWISSRKD